MQTGSSFLSSQSLSTTTILTPESSGVAFPPELLSTKTVLTPERTPGMKKKLKHYIQIFCG